MCTNVLDLFWKKLYFVCYSRANFTRTSPCPVTTRVFKVTQEILAQESHLNKPVRDVSHDGGLVVSVPAFYFYDPSSNPAG